MDFFQGLSRDVARLLAALGDDAPDEVAILLVFGRTCTDRRDLGDQHVGDTLLAIETTDPGAAAALLDYADQLAPA